MTISLGGLASGLDVDSLVTSLVDISRKPITSLTKQKAELDSASTTLSSISGKLASLKTAALALSTSVGFSSFSATSSDPAIVTSSTGSANPGSYSINVTALARGQKSRSASQPSTTTALGQAGKLSIKVGTANAVDVNVTATDTLSDIASKISGSGARVSASVLYDGTGYRLLVHGLDSGAENAFSVTETGTTFGLDSPSSVYESAQDAALTVDGMAITSKTNQITGVIPGVKLALAKTTTSAATVSVATDNASLKTKVDKFVSAYNEFVNSSHTAAGFGQTKATNQSLAADSAIRTSLQKVGSLMSAAVPNTTGAYKSLAAVGISKKADGTIGFDSTKLEAALTADPSSVRRLFITDTGTGATGIMGTLMSTIDSLTTGEKAPLQARISSLGVRSKRLKDSADKMETRLADYETQLRKQFSAMDTAVSKYQSMSTAVSAMPKISYE